MSEFLGWDLNPVSDNLKLFTNEQEAIVVSDKEVQVIVTREKGTDELIRLTVGNVSFAISHEYKVINIYRK